MDRLAHRYALALFKLSQEHDVVDTVSRDLGHIIDIIQSDRVIQNFFINPLTSFDNRYKICIQFEELLKLNSLTARMLTVLNHHNRMNLLSLIAMQFNKLNDNAQQKFTGEIITAVPLTQVMQKRLQKVYQAALGQTTEFTVRINPEIMGGIIVKAGSWMIDTSLKTRLDRIKSILQQ